MAEQVMIMREVLGSSNDTADSERKVGDMRLIVILSVHVTWFVE